MNQEAYKTFMVLAETKNFSKAAERLNVVQSTVSNRIQELEKCLQKELFIRDNKKVELTHSGKILLPYARKLVLLEDEACSKLRIGENYNETLDIESADSIFRGWVVGTTIEYLQKYRQIAVKMKIRHSQDIIQNVLDNIIDIGFTYIKPVSHKLAVYKFQEEEIILVTNSTNHHYPNGIAIKELLNLGLLYSGLGEEFNDWLYSLFPQDHTFQLELSHTSNLIEFLKAGMGYGFVLKSAVRMEISSKELIEIKLLDKKPPKLQSYMIVNKQKMDSPPVKYWLEILQDNIINEHIIPKSI